MRLSLLLVALFIAAALSPALPPAGATVTPRPLTIVAVIDSGFGPYHYDFLGSQHPWNVDADPSNDIDFTTDPATYIPGHPGATALSITLPTAPTTSLSTRRTGVDKPLWDSMAQSSTSSANVYWFPGTKVVAALKFGSEFYGDNNAHGTRSAAVAAGNWHGSCPECLFVLIQGSNDAAMRWATSQPWIDIVTNSYGAGSLVQSASGGNTRDNAYWKAPVTAMRDASEAGQVIVFSAGNGFLNAFDVPMFTYWSSQKGPDWVVTVGAVSPGEKQTYSGAGKPVDISSIGSGYSSTGGLRANSSGLHSGTSNAAPVTAGYIAKVLQAARTALGDTTPGHAGGVVASGTPVACGAAVPGCALADGILTRRELEDLVMRNALPSPTAVEDDTVWPTTGYAYYYQGHGVLTGRINNATYNAEWGQMVANMLGNAASPPRPTGEANWFIVDSKCRQKAWGAWGGGLYTGTVPPLDPVADPIAIAFNAGCEAMPAQPFGTLVGTGAVP